MEKTLAQDEKKEILGRGERHIGARDFAIRRLLGGKGEKSLLEGKESD